MNAPLAEDDVGTCAVCLEAFSASDADLVPRLLTCGHSFCTACLTHLLANEAEDAVTCKCPKCRTITRLVVDGARAAGAGVQGLPRNFDLVDLLSRNEHHQQRLPATTRKCANCSSQSADKFCDQCSVHLCGSCDTQLHSFVALRNHVRLASANAHEPRPACEHHRREKVKMWCERDAVPVCVVCLVVGPHKGHDAVTIEEAEARAREAARIELAQVEAAIGEVEAAVVREVALEAGERESAREVRATVKRHFDQVREAVAWRESSLGAEIDVWERARAEAAGARRAELAEAKKRLEAAGRAIQQQQCGTLAGPAAASMLGGSTKLAAVAEVCQAARAVAAGLRASGITFACDTDKMLSGLSFSTSGECCVQAQQCRADAAASGKTTQEGPVVEEIAMKLAQVQEKNEALHSEKLRLEGYLRTAKKMIRELRQEIKDRTEAEIVTMPQFTFGFQSSGPGHPLNGPSGFGQAGGSE